VDQKIEEARMKARASMPLTTKLEVQKELRPLERRRNLMRRELYEKQDGIDRERDGLIRQTESRLRDRRQGISPLFLVRWVLQ
jgi:adenine-specific DNA-methyltransferase